MAKAFNLDLDDTTVKTIPVTVTPKTEVIETKGKCFNDTDIVLPIKTMDTNGNPSVTLKTLQDITLDELIEWICTIYPVPASGAKNILQLDKYIKSGEFTPMKVKTTLFNMIVKMCEERFLFGLGKKIVDEKYRSN